MRRSRAGALYASAIELSLLDSPDLTRMKMLDWLVGYRQDWLRPDIMAGLITAAVVIPKAMAYATVAGLPVQAGLYTAFVPAVIYALLGSSRGLSVSIPCLRTFGHRILVSGPHQLPGAGSTPPR